MKIHPDAMKRVSSRRRKLQQNVKTVWSYSRQVFAAANVNGVTHVALAKSTGKRLLWTGLFAVGIIGWFYQTTTLLEYYYQYPSVVKIEVEKPPAMDFPAISICNVNRIRRSVFCKEFPERCKVGNIELSEEEIFNITFQFMKEGRKLELGHQLEDVIVGCEFSGTPILDTETCMTYFSYIYDPFLGNCFVFSSGNGQRPKLYVTEPDAWRDRKDMSLFLNVEEDEYLNPDSLTPGLIVTLHEDMDYPHILAHGIHVYAEHTYSLAVEKVSVNLLMLPFKTNCTDFEHLPFSSLSEMNLSPRMCSVECLLHHQKEECPHSYVTDNVVLFADAMPYDPHEITKADKLCADSLSENYKEYCSSLCSVPCHDTYYPVVVDSSPTSTHKIVVSEEDLNDYKRRRGDDKKIFVSDVRIHYQSMEHKIFNHTPEFTTELLFSYLGGISGGWLGISLLEFCAFIEGLFSVLLFSTAYCRPRKRKRKHKSHKGAPATPMCRCGGVLLGVPVAKPGRLVQVVPYGYY